MKSLDVSDILGYDGICSGWCMMADNSAYSECAVYGGCPNSIS